MCLDISQMVLSTWLRWLAYHPEITQTEEGMKAPLPEAKVRQSHFPESEAEPTLPILAKGDLCKGHWRAHGARGQVWDRVNPHARALGGHRCQRSEAWFLPPSSQEPSSESSRGERGMPSSSRALALPLWILHGYRFLPSSQMSHSPSCKDIYQLPCHRRDPS